MSALVIDFSAYVKRESYRPTLSGEDSRKKEADLELLRKVKERLDKAERDGIDAEGNQLFAHLRESSNAKIAELEADLLEAKEKLRIAEKARNMAEASALASKAEIAEAMKGLHESGMVALPMITDAKSRPLGPKLLAEQMRRRRTAHWPALVERAAVLAAAAFRASPADLTREVGSGARFSFTAEYKMAKMSFFHALHLATGVSMTRLVPDLGLKDKAMATLFIHRYRNFLEHELYTEKHPKVCEALEAYALELEGKSREVAR